MTSTQETALPAVRVGRFSGASQSLLFRGGPTPRSASPVSEIEDEREAVDDSEATIEWTHEEVVMLHAILFDTSVEKLNDPKTSLDEVVDCLRWILSEPGKETQAFSFSNTLKLYQRRHPRYIREAIERGLKRYLNQRFACYPIWVAQAFWSDPDRFADELERNPQWIHESLRQVAPPGDLFAA